MNISHRTGRLSRRRAAPRSRLPLLQGCPAMAGLSALPPGGPPNEVERQPALTHRPNSGTRPTLRGTAFQPHSGAAGPPPFWVCCRARATV